MHQQLQSTRSSQDSDFFWRSIKSQSLLSEEEVIDLARKVQRWRSLSEDELVTEDGRKIAAIGLRSKNKLVQRNMLLVSHWAHKLHRTNQSFELMDLIQEGAIGLSHAVDLFDPSRGCRFSTYATPWIKQHMRRAIADRGRTIRLPVHFYDKLSKIKRGVFEFVRDFRRQPTLEELSIAIEMPVKQIDRIMRITAQTNAFSLDSMLYGEEEDGCLMELLPDTRSGNDLDSITSLDEVERWISWLPSEKQRFAAQRYWVDRSLGEDVSLESIGREFDERFGKQVSRQAVQVSLKQARYHIKKFAQSKEN